MSFFDILLNVIVAIIAILAFIGTLYSCKTESNDYMHDYFGLPREHDLSKLPDEITIEIVKESPGKKQDAQADAAAHLSISEDLPSSSGRHRPKGTGVYLPE